MTSTRTVGLFGSFDWSLYQAVTAFWAFWCPPLRYRGERFAVRFERVEARPVLCGDDPTRGFDVLFDRATSWNGYNRNLAFQAMNSGARLINDPYAYAAYNKHSTYDLLARAMHPADHFPRTVLLPNFGPMTEDHHRQERWVEEQELILAHTRHGWDPARRSVDWAAVQKGMAYYDAYVPKSRRLREEHYRKGDFLREAMETVFGDRYPVYLKTTDGSGGRDVHRIGSLADLYEAYDRGGGKATYHIQEAVEDYDAFVRCIAVGPRVTPLAYDPRAPHHARYPVTPCPLDVASRARLTAYVRFIGAYHRWTVNSFEAAERRGALLPIDFANACPDVSFTSLHVHFPRLVIEILAWLCYCAVAGPWPSPALDHARVLSVLNDAGMTASERFDWIQGYAGASFPDEDFAAFRRENFGGALGAMVDFYDRRFAEVIEHAVAWSFFPPADHLRWRDHYRHLLDEHFRRDPKRFLGVEGESPR